MNGVLLSTRDLAITYLYGMEDGAVVGGVSPYPYCPVALSWWLNLRVDRSLRAMRRMTSDGEIQTAFEFPERLFSLYALDQVGFKDCLEDIASSACRKCVFNQALPRESMPSLTLNDRINGRSRLDLRSAATDYSVEWHNQDFGGRSLCQALIQQVSCSVIAMSEQSKKGREVKIDYPAIITSANPQLEPLMFHPELPLGNIPVMDFKLGKLKAGTHHKARR